MNIADLTIKQARELSAMFGGGWIVPNSKPVYVTSQSLPTFSFFEKSIAIMPATTSHDFAQEIASVFASLSEGQEPLGVEFEAVWDANVDALYQS